MLQVFLLALSQTFNNLQVCSVKKTLNFMIEEEKEKYVTIFIRSKQHEFIAYNSMANDDTKSGGKF